MYIITSLYYYIYKKQRELDTNSSYEHENITTKKNVQGLVLKLQAELRIETLSNDSLQLSKSSYKKLAHVFHIVVLV